MKQPDDIKADADADALKKSALHRIVAQKSKET
jgi:hypothetical protein